LFLRFQYVRAFAIDVNIRVLAQSQFGHLRPTRGQSSPTCSTGSAPHCLHFLFLPHSLFMRSPFRTTKVAQFLSLFLCQF
jgi:hypothetical protein